VSDARRASDDSRAKTEYRVSREESVDDDRLASARAVLTDAGIDADVSAAGFAADVLAVAAPVTQLERVAALSERLKATGFRWIALEPPGDPG